MLGTLTIVVMKGPYSSRHPEFAYEIAQQALTKGHKVNMFFLLDGVHIPKKNQDPKNFASVNEALARLLRKEGFTAVSCEMSAHERGYVCGEVDSSGVYPTDQYIEGAEIRSSQEFALFVKKSEKVLALNM